MSSTLTVTVEINLTHEALNQNLPWGDAEKIALAKIREVVGIWAGAVNHCVEGARYGLVLDLPRDQATLGALLYWCEYGHFLHTVRWFTGELAIAQGT